MTIHARSYLSRAFGHGENVLDKIEGAFVIPEHLTLLSGVSPALRKGEANCITSLSW